MSKSALEAPRSNVFLMDPDELIIIGLDEGDDTHVLYDPRIKLPVDPDLVTSIMKKGVLQPVMVRKEGTKAIVIDGRQRIRAAREANKKLDTPVRVPTIVQRVDDAEAFYRHIELNELRTDDDLSCKIKKAKGLFDKGYAENEVAEAFGVTTNTIRNWMTLADCHPRVRAAVEAGSIRMTDAIRELATLPRDEQAEAADKLAENKPTRQTRKDRGEKIKKGVSPAARLKALREIEEELPPGIQTLLKWLGGEVKDRALSEAIPACAALFRKK